MLLLLLLLPVDMDATARRWTALLGHCVKHGVLNASSSDSGGGVLPKVNLGSARVIMLIRRKGVLLCVMLMVQQRQHRQLQYTKMDDCCAMMNKRPWTCAAATWHRCHGARPQEAKEVVYIHRNAVITDAQTRMTS